MRKIEENIDRVWDNPDGMFIFIVKYENIWNIVMKDIFNQWSSLQRFNLFKQRERKKLFDVPKGTWLFFMNLWKETFPFQNKNDSKWNKKKQNKSD